MRICSYLLENDNIMDIAGLIVDIMALLVSIFLTVGIYKLERRHEKSREKAEEDAKNKAIAEAARVFSIDNDDLEYLPLAVIAINLNLKRKHYRKLITRFMRCNEPLQQEILRQSNIADIPVSMTTAERALESLKEDLDKNHFGRNILYDGAKYLHRAFDRWAGSPIMEVCPYIFERPQASKNGVLARAMNQIEFKTSLCSYMEDYLHAAEQGIDENQLISPIDMVFQRCNLGSCDEDIMTFWTMRIIIDACYTFRGSEHKEIYEIFDETLIQSQEDMYYYTLAVLCSAYPEKRNNADKDVTMAHSCTNVDSEKYQRSITETNRGAQSKNKLPTTNAKFTATKILKIMFAKLKDIEPKNGTISLVQIITIIICTASKWIGYAIAAVMFLGAIIDVFFQFSIFQLVASLWLILMSVVIWLIARLFGAASIEIEKTNSPELAYGFASFLFAVIAIIISIVDLG